MLALMALALASTSAVSSSDMAAMQEEIAAERATILEQQKRLDEERARLDALESRLASMDGRPTSAPIATPTAGIKEATAPTPTVGEPPTEKPRPVEIAALSRTGGIVTRAGRLTLEQSLEYTHADDNSVIFRGIEVPASVLIGVFDINRIRQEVVTSAMTARFGITDRLEVNVRVPYTYRAINSVLTPVADTASGPSSTPGGHIANGGIGDVEFGARYEVAGGRGGAPYLVAGMQAIAPTGTNPFDLRFDSLGNPLQAATGSGFWGLTPSLTAILPSDPAVLFATLGYTFNIGHGIDRTIGASYLQRINPGDEPSAAIGLALSLNQRLSMSLGYAHTMVLHTQSWIRATDTRTGNLGALQRVDTQDLQIGRLLFGISYRMTARTTINWSVETGVTKDAPDVRTSLRIPLTLDLF